MNNKERLNKLGDCPGLDGGPVSCEHELRFQQQNVQQGTIGDNGGINPIVQKAQNHKKEEARPS